MDTLQKLTGSRFGIDNKMMATVLLDQLEHLRQRVPAQPCDVPGDWASLAEDVAEMSAAAVYLLQRIERAASRKQPASPGTWDELAAREFIPLFQSWFEYATAVRELRRACKVHGYALDGVEEFLHAFNRAKMMALDFDQHVEAERRIARGESRGRPLEEVANELLDRARIDRD